MNKEGKKLLGLGTLATIYGIGYATGYIHPYAVTMVVGGTALLGASCVYQIYDTIRIERKEAENKRRSDECAREQAEEALKEATMNGAVVEITGDFSNTIPTTATFDTHPPLAEVTGTAPNDAVITAAAQRVSPNNDHIQQQ